MASNDVTLGGGNATAMAYYAPASTATALPAYPLDTPGAGWVNIGSVAESGPVWTPFGEVTVIRDWSKTAVRQTSNSPGHVQAPIISTTEESLKAVFGADNVTISAATASHGKLISVTPEAMAVAQSYLFIGKDGDDSFMLGTLSGTITELGDITFNADNTITWQPTIEGKWTFMKDDGQTT